MPIFSVIFLKFRLCPRQAPDQADKVILLTNYNILALVLCNFAWSPLALVFRKRPVIIVALTILLAASLRGGYATSYDSLLPGGLVQSLGDGAVEALGHAVVYAIFHQNT